MAERRRSSSSSRTRSASRSPRPAPILGRLAGPADHRHAALLAQRPDPALRRLAQQHVRSPRARGIRGADRADRVRDGSVNFMPELLALSASSPFVEDVDPASTRRERRSSPACSLAAACPTSSTHGASGRDYVRFSTRPARSPSTRRSGGACARTSPSRRSRSGSATRSPTSARRTLAAFISSLTARRSRVDEGEAIVDQPHRLIEENFWRDPVGALGRADRPPRRGDVPPGAGAAGAARGVDPPVADELGGLAPGGPAANAAERQRRGSRKARRVEIYAERGLERWPSRQISRRLIEQIRRWRRRPVVDGRRCLLRQARCVQKPRSGPGGSRSTRSGRSARARRARPARLRDSGRW